MTDQPDEGAAQPDEGAAQPDEGAARTAGDPAPSTRPRVARGGRGAGSTGRRSAPGASVRATDLGVRPGDLPKAVRLPAVDAEGAPEDRETADAAPSMVSMAVAGRPADIDATPADAPVGTEPDPVGAAAGVDPVGPGAGIGDDEPLPVEVTATWACPLLRRLDDAGRLGEAGPTIDPWHRCTAETPPSPLADQQQTLVCLTEAHVDCPRYHRAAAPVPVPPQDPVSRIGLSPATVAATVVLLMSFFAALSFVAVNGGIGVPTPQPSDGVAVVSPRPSVVASPDATPVASPIEASPSPLSSAENPSPTSAATPEPSATPVTSPRPSTTVVPSPTSDRYRLLVACPDRPECYVYTVRRGDNLTSIGLYFGVPFDTILRLNRWITDPTTIRPGDDIILPPPTR